MNGLLRIRTLLAILTVVSILWIAAPGVAYGCYNWETKPYPSQSIDQGESKPKKAAKWYERARSHSEKKEYEKAIDCYEKCLKLNPGHTCANNGLAWLFLTAEDSRFRDTQKALILARRAVSSGTGRICGACWDTLGLAYEVSGNRDQAHLSYLKAITLQGNRDIDALKHFLKFIMDEGVISSMDDSEPVNHLRQNVIIQELRDQAENSLFRIENQIKAMDYATLALIAAPQHRESYYFRYIRASAWRMLGEELFAFFDVTVSIDRFPRYAEAYSLRAKLFLESGQEKEALEDLNKAAALSPENSFILYHRGIAHLCLGDYRTAVADLTKAITLGSPDYDFFYARAVAYERLGYLESAQSDLRMALELNPKFERASSLMKRLRDKTNALPPGMDH